MRILDKYINKQIAGSFFFILSLFIGLYLIIDIFSTLSDILKAKPPAIILLQYYGNSLPLIILRVSPFALLIGTLYTFSELNKHNEIICLRSSGLSVIRIAFPVIFFAFLVSTSLLFLQEKVLINSQKTVEDIKSEFIKKKPVSQEINKFAFTSGNNIIFVEKYTPSDMTMRDVVIFQENKKGDIIKKTLAKEVVYEYGSWKGKNITQYELDPDGTITNFPKNSDEANINLSEKPRDLLLKKSTLARFESLFNLRKRINNLKKAQAGKQLTNLIVDYHQKITDSFTAFFLIIGILPIAFEVKKRKAGLSSLGIGFVFSLIYYAVYSFGIAMGKTGIILPFFSAWLAPFFFLTVGVTGLSLTK